MLFNNSFDKKMRQNKLNNGIMVYVKEILLLIFWIIIFLSIFIPNSLSFWLNDGFNY